MAAARAGDDPRVEYLADLQGRFSSVVIGWGVLGINTCVHQPDRTPLPLKIKDKTYDRGLGAHAPGHIAVDLDGEYETFEAEVGVQWQGQNIGSVVFQVFVDGEKRFDSGVMREADEPKRVRVSVRGAQELALVMTDAGDGIICDCANWAEARLTPAARPTRRRPDEYLDAGLFARVVTCDPLRKEGARAGRIEEFLAEDIFLESDVPRRADGSCEVPAYEGGVGCIGLWWMEPRRLRELGVEFPGPAPSPEGVRVEYWQGETWWQGQWVPAAGSVQAGENNWTVVLSRDANAGLAAGTRKVRWIIPSAEGLVISRLWASARARLKTSRLVLQLDRPQLGRRAEVEAYNGLLAVGSGRFRTRCTWDLGKPLRLRVKHTGASFLGAADRTLLLIRLPEGGFGVAVQDALAGDGVYVRPYGVLAARDPAPMTPAEYRRRIAGRKSVLDIVHECPDQTFAAAMAAVHRPIQNNGPTMLSLACHNAKYVAERAGAVRFGAFLMQPRYGSGAIEGLRRSLDGGWLPAPVSTVEEGGLVYRQRTFVAPVDDERPAGAPDWLRERAVCVAEVDVENPTGQLLPASVQLSFLADAGASRAARVVGDGPCAEICDGDRLLAVVDASGAPDLRLHSGAKDGLLALSGDVAPGDRARVAVFIPSWEAAASDHLRFRDSLSLFADFAEYWRSVLSDAMQVDIPEPLLADVIRASQVHCLIAARNEDGGRRIEPWIAADRYGPLESEANSIIYG
ncbi:MAG: NPCBM/NEW2 domain-containing protein, partial [Armatimonadetes bacterium]|nr:NPCBM/NEW2 domain-containing protein [Armatimonadota bacterium]